MKKLLLPALLLGLSSAYAQQLQRCSSYEYQQQQLAADPALQGKIDAVEEDCAEYAQTYPNGYQSRAVVTIPVVFHIVYGTTAENISATRIYEQVQVLNQDYRKQNTDISNVPAAWQGIAADCEIQFCLAAVDPNGNWTDGIHRVSTTVPSFDDNDDVKRTADGGTNAWDRNKYLNIWVCDLGSMLLGYAQFPGGAASTDGVVLHYRYTGKTGAISPYNKGRTATHEVGHWLGLRHIWADDGGGCTQDDNVSDTPKQASENYGCFAVGSVQTDGCSSSAPGIMWSNYMDYTDDACMYFFTSGQKTRMWAVLNGSRLPLQTSTGCVIAGVQDLSLSHVFTLYPNPTDGMVTLDFGGAAPSDYDVTVFNTLGEKVKQVHLDMLSEQTFQLDLRDQSAGLYFVEVRNQSDKITRRVLIQ
ncbi:MAG TPA: M43 family zinc metalloprotease [Bacteroidia bacterium]|nr:M43 family zinc metalloprotease [Bacteroidia bacterium]